MNARTTALAKEAEQLPPEDRIELAEFLLASIEPDPEIDAAWAEEAERRVDAYLRGDTKAYDLDDVMSRLRQRPKNA